MLTYYPPLSINFTDFRGGTPIPNAYDSVIEHERNGRFDLVFRYPLIDNKYKDFKDKTIFMAEVPYLGKQPFLLSSIKKHLGFVEVYAKHKGFSIGSNVSSEIKSLGGGDTGQSILDKFEASLQIPHDFTFYSNITKKHIFNTTEWQQSLKPLTEGKHSILGQWGGVLIMDGKEIKLMDRFGRDTEYLIAKRKNINDIEIVEDNEGIVTRLFLTLEVETGRVDSEGDAITEKIQVSIDSPLIDEYPSITGRVINVTDETVKTREDLIFYGQELFRTQRIDLPSESFRIDVTSNVKDYKFTIDDTALVYYEDYDIYKRVMVQSYSYDPISKKYLEVIFGDKEKSMIEQTTAKVTEEIEGTLQSSEDRIKDIIDEITKNLGDAEGGIIKLRKDNLGNINEILILDNENLELARNIWRLNIQGISHSSNGINGRFDVAMTQSGKIVADFIATGTLNAALIKTGIISSLDGKVQIDIDNGNLDVHGGAMTLTNSNGVVIIDGTSNMFKIAVDRTVVVDGAATKNYTLPPIAHGLGVVPAHMAYQVDVENVSQSGLSGGTMLPAFSMGLSANPNELSITTAIRISVDSQNVYINYYRAIPTAENRRVKVRFYLYQEKLM